MYGVCAVPVGAVRGACWPRWRPCRATRSSPPSSATAPASQGETAVNLQHKPVHCVAVCCWLIQITVCMRPQGPVTVPGCDQAPPAGPLGGAHRARARQQVPVPGHVRQVLAPTAERPLCPSQGCLRGSLPYEGAAASLKGCCPAVTVRRRRRAPTTWQPSSTAASG